MFGFSRDVTILSINFVVKTIKDEASLVGTWDRVQTNMYFQFELSAQYIWWKCASLYSFNQTKTKAKAQILRFTKGRSVMKMIPAKRRNRERESCTINKYIRSHQYKPG